ncbi:MAG: sulfatase-like hydrolase/transferase [Desulfobacterales bacterium]
MSSKPWWPPRVTPPKEAPNVLLIITDDSGFGVPSTFGGVIPTPAMDRVAQNGLRYNNIHSTALCSPTRAALITGCNHHSVGFGVISEQSTGFPGYNSIISRDKATIGRILLENGYATSWFGKDHNTPAFAASQVGPFDQWPTGMGFEYFYGFVGGDANQWQPNLFRNTTQIYPFEGKPGWNLVTGMADDAIDYLNRINQIQPDKPFFVKYAPGATHAPHHPTEAWVKKIHDMHLFDDGWEKLRETIFANQKKLGVIPADTQLEPWPEKVIKKWDDCTPEEKKLFIKQVEIFAAYEAYMDHEIGRVIQAVEDMGKLDDTLIIYINGDNGTSAEGGPLGTPNEVAFFNGVSEMPVDVQMKWYDVWGTEQTYNHMSAGWSWAFDTPFTWFKQNASKLGGIRQCMAISWPGHITDKGGLREQFMHVIDVVPTILEVTGISAPETVDGIKQAPIEGTILTSGGRFAGYGFYLQEGKPTFLWNLIDLKRIKWQGPDALAPGKHTIEFDFKYDGLGLGTLAFNNMSGLGRSGTGTLKVDDKVVQTIKMERTLPMILQWDESFDIGSDTLTGVNDADYKPPFTLTAKLDKLTITVDRPQLSEADIKTLETKMSEAMDGTPLKRVQPGPQ